MDVTRGVWRGAWLLVLVLGATTIEGRAQIPWDESRWDVRAQESRVETYLGREALFLRGGTAWLRDSEFRDGVIEFDVAATDQQGFHGLRFRAVDRFNHEHVYLRPHLSGKSDAVQYTPVFNANSGWQMYSDARYAQAVEIVPDRWVHVRVAVQGRRMEMTVDDQLLVFPELVRDPASGMVGINSGAAPARFANVVVRPGADPGFRGDAGSEPVPAPDGAVSLWRISGSFPEADLGLELTRALRESQAWVPLRADIRGLANISKVAERPDGENNTVFAALTLRAEEATTVPVGFAFSDRVRVYLNGRLLYAGDDGYRTRDYRFLGTMGFFDELFLPLEAGDNELWLAVSEDFGGWGVGLRMDPLPGVRVADPR